jgi:hypothetical protein
MADPGLSLVCQSIILCHLSVYLLPDADQWLTLDRRAYDEGEGQARERLSQLLHSFKKYMLHTAFLNTGGIMMYIVHVQQRTRNQTVLLLC